MNIQQLLSAHALHSHDQILKDCLGDASLFHFNPIYKNIRLSALQLKSSFQTPPHSDYLTLPYTQLEHILKSNCVPYFDNVSVLKKMPQKLNWANIEDSVRKNFVFHESCHLVARSHTKSQFKIADSQNKIFLSLLEESFANTLELLSIIYAKDSVHRAFYKLNSFTSLFEHFSQFQEANKELGTFELFHMTLIAYVYSNFLKASLNEIDYKLILDMTFQSKLRSLNDKAIKSLLKLPFQLDLDFRLHITPLHLLLCGQKVTAMDLRKFPIRDFLVKNQQLIKTMIQEALRKS